MGISIAIATYNRADELALTLASLARIDTAGVDYEVLVVANNCTDHTRRVVGECDPALRPRVRYLDERRQGLSHARNRAIAEARYDVVAFLDDDVDLDAGWLQALHRAYAVGDYAAVGGKADLVYPTCKPRWLPGRLEGLLSRVDRGQAPRPAEAEELYGLNLSLKRAWLDRVGPFRTDQGRVGTCLLGGEEKELLTRVAAAGGQLLYEPAAIVGHRVAPERLRRRWFWSRCYWGNVGESRILADEMVSLYALTQKTWHLARTSSRLVKAFLTRGAGSEEFFYQTACLAGHVGAWVGLYQRLSARYRSWLLRSNESRREQVGPGPVVLAGEPGA